eukprot:1159656-Pelagomonas_calceolata.AAC.20
MSEKAKRMVRYRNSAIYLREKGREGLHSCTCLRGQLTFKEIQHKVVPIRSFSYKGLQGFTMVAYSPRLWLIGR